MRPTAPARWQGTVAESPPGCINPVRSEAPSGGGKLQQGGNGRVMQRVITQLRHVDGQQLVGSACGNVGHDAADQKVDADRSHPGTSGDVLWAHARRDQTLDV